MSAERASSDSAAMRLDIWLWRARLFKTRSAAAARILEGGVRLGGESHFAPGGSGLRIAKPASLVRSGDAMTLAAPRGLISLTVLALPKRRGPPAEGRACYTPIGCDASATLDEWPSHPSSSTSFEF